MTTTHIFSDETGANGVASILRSENHFRAMASEMVKQTALLGVLAETTASAAILSDWVEFGEAIAEGDRKSVV